MNEKFFNLMKGANLESTNYTTIMVFSPKNINKQPSPIFYYSTLFIEDLSLEYLIQHMTGKMGGITNQKKIDNYFSDDSVVFVLDTGEKDQVNQDKYFEIKLKSDNQKFTMYICYMHISNFFNSDNFDKICTCKNINNKTKFVLCYNNNSIGFIKAMFRTLNINLSSGNNTLKGVLSPENMFLSAFVIFTFGVEKGQFIVEYSHSVLTKNRALTRSIFDYNNFHEKKRLNFYDDNMIGVYTSNMNLPRISTLKKVNPSINSFRKYNFKGESSRAEIEKIQFLNRYTRYGKRKNNYDANSSKKNYHTSTAALHHSNNFYSSNFTIYLPTNYLPFSTKNGDKNHYHILTKNKRHFSSTSLLFTITNNYTSNKTNVDKTDLKIVGSNYNALYSTKSLKHSDKSNMFIKSQRSFSTTTTSKQNKIDNTFKYDSPIYKNLNMMIKDNPINDETQKKIEKYLLEYSYISLEHESKKPFVGINYSIINSKLSKLLLDSKESLIKLIVNFKEELRSNKPIKSNKMDLVLIESKIILLEISNEYLVNIIYGSLLKILSTYKISQGSKNNVVDVGFNLGKDLINNYYYNMYLKSKSKKIDEIYHLSNWKSENKILVNKLEDQTLIFSLGSILIGWALTCDLLEKKTITLSIKEKSNIVLPAVRLIETISKNGVYNLPKRIPMLVPPKPYTNKWLGGYLLNDEITTDSLIKNSRKNKELTTIRNDNVIYNLVNNISSVGYKINKEVLEFILYYNHDYFNDEIIDIKYIHPLLKKKSKLTRREKTELDSFLSKKELQENILGLASVFSELPSFYIPVNLDFRGRLYCIPEFLNYQSTELAKALLLFSKAEKIDKNDTMSINYLKLFGATSFGLDKKSAKDRLDWVDSNIKNIIDFRNGELIKKAENKFLFLAFCFEYNRWLICLENNDISEFETSLPIQLDATCNGFQHLSLLSLDSNLALELNLNESSWNDKPKDFYSFLVSSLMDHFKTELDNNKDLSVEKQEGYQRLIDFNLKRFIIKKSIMTIPYNVTSFQLINYIKENFERIDKSEWFSIIGDKKLKLKNSDFSLLGNGLREVLDYKFPKLNLLLTYLEGLVKVCTLLQIPVLWTLPSGLEVKQSYVMEDEIRIKPFYYHKNTFVLKVVNKSKFNDEKQIRAFMPNLVHSLDAASLALLLDFYFEGRRNGQKNIFTVHDCFGVTANNISNLMDILKLTYVKIYSEDTYLKKLDKGIRDSIKNVYGEDSFDEKTGTIHISTSNTTINFPDVDVVLGKKIEFDFNNIIKSKYILN